MKTPFQLKQRMYGLVPYNISPIQQGIQFGHAVVEYGLTQTQQDPTDTELSPYNQWAHLDKTFIILNGGTTNKDQNNLGTMNFNATGLHAMGIHYATFYEPDLGDQLTAVAFLVDERVYDYETYPTYDFIRDEVSEMEYYETMFGDDATWILELRQFLSKFRLA
jgi:hypothetical protein